MRIQNKQINVVLSFLFCVRIRLVFCFVIQSSLLSFCFVEIKILQAKF